MIRRPPRSTQSRSSAASDVYKRQLHARYNGHIRLLDLSFPSLSAHLDNSFIDTIREVGPGGQPKSAAPAISTGRKTPAKARLTVDDEVKHLVRIWDQRSSKRGNKGSDMRLEQLCDVNVFRLDIRHLVGFCSRQMGGGKIADVVLFERRGRVVHLFRKKMRVALVGHSIHVDWCVCICFGIVGGNQNH